MQHNINWMETKKHSKNIQTLYLYLSDKNVTKSSKFRDDKWVFESKPNRTVFDFSFYNKKLKNDNLIIFWKLFSILYIQKNNLQNKGQEGFIRRTTHLIYFLNELNFLRNHNEEIVISIDIIEMFILKLKALETSKHNKKQHFEALGAWYSVSNFLPSYLKFSNDAINDFKAAIVFNDTVEGNNEESESGWAPLTIPEAMILARESIKWIEEYASDILQVYSQWEPYIGKYTTMHKYSAFGRDYSDLHGTSNAKNLKLAEIVYESVPHTIKHNHPLHKIFDIANQFSKNEIGRVILKRTISQRDISDALKKLYAACVILILFSTGMRKSELFSLDRNCLDIKSNPEMPLIESEVFKTNTGTTKLPISKTGALAVQILQKIGFILSKQDEGPLMIPLENHLKDADRNRKAQYSSHLFILLDRFCTMLGFSQPPNTHAFRHTLAACVWERTEQAPVLLKLLFNHTSLSMTLQYLRNNILLKNMRKELFAQKYKPLVVEVLKHNNNKELAGPAVPLVENLVSYVKSDLMFKGKTEEELEIAMEDLFMTLIEQDQIRLFLTPLCICMRSSSSVSKSPCMLVEDYGDTLYSKLPRTDRCVGSTCHESLFTPFYQNMLDDTMSYYDEFIHQLPEDLKSNIYISKIVDKELKQYSKIADKYIKEVENA